MKKNDNNFKNLQKEYLYVRVRFFFLSCKLLHWKFNFILPVEKEQTNNLFVFPGCQRATLILRIV